MDYSLYIKIENVDETYMEDYSQDQSTNQSHLVHKDRAVSYSQDGKFVVSFSKANMNYTQIAASLPRNDSSAANIDNKFIRLKARNKYKSQCCS